MKWWKEILRETLIMAVLLGVVNVFIHKELNAEIVFQSVFTAFLSSVLFFNTFPRVFKYLFKSVEKRMMESISEVELDADEQLLLTGGANHFKGIERVGGMLTLTSRRLVFRSHKYNIQNHQQEFALTEIKEIALDKHKSGKVMALALTDDEIHRFGVDSPADWIRLIRREPKGTV